MGEDADEPSRAVPAVFYKTTPEENIKPAVMRPAPEVEEQKPVKKLSLSKRPQVRKRKSASPPAEIQAERKGDVKKSEVVAARVPPLGMVALVKDNEVIKEVWVEKEGRVRPFEPKAELENAGPVEADLANETIPKAADKPKEKKDAETLMVHKAEAAGSPAIWRGSIAFDSKQAGPEISPAGTALKSRGQDRGPGQSAVEEAPKVDGQISNAVKPGPVGG